MEARSLADEIEALNVLSSSEAEALWASGAGLRLSGFLLRTCRGLHYALRSRRLREPQWQEVLQPVTTEFQRWLAAAKAWERSLAAPQGGEFREAAQAEIIGGARLAAGGWRLTVLLLTRNEARQIERCLSSVRWADEIVVVDGESTDGTAERCRAFGATVVSRPFCGSFAEERNAGLDVASGDWVLQMDADERVTPGLRMALERVLSSQGGGVAAYQVYRRNIFLGRFMRYGGWYHDHLCLFRRTGHRYHGLVHERLNVRGEIGHLRADLEHEPFRSLEQFITRQNRYTTLQARELLETNGVLPWRTVEPRLRRRALNRWWKFYVKKQGFREGMHGLVFSTLFAWVELLIWAKYCELAYGPSTPPAPRVGA